MSGADFADALRAAALVGVLGLDQVAVGQCMISQPLVGGVILGWACGEPGLGLLAGVFFQFLCLTDLRVGGSIPPDNVFAGLLGSAVFLRLPHPAGWSDGGMLGLITLFFLPVAYLARLLEVRICAANRFWGTLAESLVGLGRFRLAQAAALGGIMLFFLKAFLPAALTLVAVSLGSGAWLAKLVGMNESLELFAWAVPLVALGGLVAQRRRAGWPAAVAAGMGAGVLLAGSFA